MGAEEQVLLRRQKKPGTHSIGLFISRLFFKDKIVQNEIGERFGIGATLGLLILDPVTYHCTGADCIGNDVGIEMVDACDRTLELMRCLTVAKYFFIGKVNIHCIIVGWGKPGSM